MTGLYDAQEKIYIKPGAAELASVFLDVLDAVKSAPQATKQLVDEHKALKQTKADHQGILEENKKTLASHQASRTAWSIEQQKDKEARDKHAKEIAEKLDNLTKRETSLNVRDTALSREDKRLKEKAAAQLLKDEQHKKKDDELFIKEQNLNTLAEKLKKEQSDWNAKLEASRKAIA